MIESIIRERYTSFGLGKINFLPIAKKSLRKMRGRQVFTVGDVYEIRKCKEKDEEKPEAAPSQSSTS
jgi:hypothetical protein